MQHEEIARLQGLLDAATDAPWLDADGTTSGRVVVAPDQPKVRYSVASCGGQRRNANAELIAEMRNALPSLLAQLTADSAALDAARGEIERLRGLLIDPGDPAWEDARGVLVAELRKNGMDTHADNIAAGHGVTIPSWIALNLIGQARRAALDALPARQGEADRG
jgi:hypothetical protein